MDGIDSRCRLYGGVILDIPNLQLLGRNLLSRVAYSRPAINTQAPAFRLMDLEGEAHSLPHTRGKWCF